MTLAPDETLPRTDAIARDMLAVLDTRRPIAPLSEREPGFDPAAAYRVAAAVRALREARGERPVGRKIGFTNRTIWAEYGVHAPIWGTVYDTTLHGPAERHAPFDLSRCAEPRIEPEIAFRLSRAPEPGMDERALVSCLEWVAHGFEIVQSPFPGWRFKPADTIAAFGLHGALLLGPPEAVAPADAAAWHDRLAGFGIALLRDGVEADRGTAANVLGGGPLSALRHLVQILADDPESPPLRAGEIVATGTLTRALPVAPGERWSTALEGVPLPGMSLDLR
jgi:2-oxo-3-hexenedioate decarboxylase